VDNHQQQYAGAALRRLLVNDPCVMAAVAGSTAEHTAKLLHAGREVWQECKVALTEPAALQQLRRLWTLLRVLQRLPPDDIRVTRFMVDRKVCWDARVKFLACQHKGCACASKPVCCKVSPVNSMPRVLNTCVA
jgi:hypothetical protein